MYVITGATGNTGKLIAQNLLAAGKPVKVVGRSAEKLAGLVAQGAVPAIGDLADAAFLTTAFQGATAVYLLVPPKWDLTDWRAYQRTVSQAFIQALGSAGVKKAVLLSSVGAHLPEGAGPVSGLAELELALGQVPGLDVVSLRAGFFMENFYANIGLMKQAGFFGYSLSEAVSMPVVHTRDIAEVATRRLLDLDFTGHTHEFVAGPADLTMPQVARTLGRVVGRPDLGYVRFPVADAKAGMMRAGLPETIADGYNELFDALNRGVYLEGYTRTAAVSTPTTLEWFAENEFKGAFGEN